ncbi:hypothetical protein MNB_SUP05-7-980 [hydrothermal vent metagenome]|uniref:Uncharacterized protein n=1 Tax=hydrothermal vent metagenome TaxID=652676 RepID=A0A1W1DVJ1_9ZZZZ
MTVVVHRHTADIHTHLIRIDWMEIFFLPAKRVVYFKHGVILR